MVDPFAGRSEISAEEYRHYVAAQTAQNGPGRETPGETYLVPSSTQTPRTDRSTHPQTVKESAFRDAVVALARSRGWLVMWTWNSRHSPKGWPDLFCVRAGRLVAMELKVGRNQPSTEQWDWLKALAVAGVETFVFRPEDWPAIEEVLC